MNKKRIIYIFNTLCLLSAIFLLVALPSVFVAGQYWKATRPSFLQYIFSQIPILCSVGLFLISALPVKVKLNTKIPDIEKCIDSLLLLCFCFSALDFFFEMRMEFFRFFGLLSSDMEKLLALLFYGLLYGFFKTKNYYLRITTIIVGVINVIYIPVYNNLFYENNVFTIREVSCMLPFVVYILMLFLFLSLERAIYSAVPHKQISSNYYFIGRYIASDNSRYALFRSNRFRDINLYSYETGKKWRVYAPPGENIIFESDKDYTDFRAQLEDIETLEFKSERDLV